jgi:thioredoxin-related protein
MHRILTILVLFMILATVVASGQSEKPEKAEIVLKAALQQAGGANKTVLLIFHASWCGWCKRLDAVLENPDMKNIMNNHYVITHLDVMESGAKKALENPGGNEMLGDYGGAKSGLPFYAFLDSEGKKIADSNVMPKDQNIGYPGTPEEIVAFEKLLQRTAPRMTDEQRGKIVAYLQKNAPH